MVSKNRCAARRWSWFFSVIVALSFSPAHAKPTTLPAIALPAVHNPLPAPDQRLMMPRQTLLDLYRAELGQSYQDSDADVLFGAHRLIESYFEAQSGAERKTILAELSSCGAPPEAIGRLTRVRMRWPELAPGIYYVDEKFGRFRVRYFLGVPAAYSRARSWPLVVSLPEIQPFLASPPPDSEGVAKIYNDAIQKELAHHPDALLLMPVFEINDLFGPSFVGMDAVMQPINHAADAVNIDPARVYLIGHSTGGFAAWNLAINYPTIFSSFTALAGGAAQDWQRTRLPVLRNTYPIAWADQKDTFVTPEFTRGIITELKNLKIDCEYAETKNFGHNPPNSVVDDCYAIMRHHVRSVYPDHVTLQSSRSEVQFNRCDWIQLWQEKDTGAEEHVNFSRARGRMTVYKNSAKIDAKRDGNNFEITLDNVESLRIYLNDQMVDFHNPVKIVINKKKPNQGFVKRSIAEMMNDQLFLGRGWRYYTAVLDIDTSEPTTRPTTKPTTRTGKITIGPPAAR